MCRVGKHISDIKECQHKGLELTFVYAIVNMKVSITITGSNIYENKRIIAYDEQRKTNRESAAFQ